MTELFFIDNSGKKRRGILKTCQICNKDYITRITNPNKTCSATCGAKIHRNRIIVQCAQCNSNIEKQKCKLNGSKSGLYFCNRKCKEQAQKLGGIKEIQPNHYGTGKSYRNLFTDEELFCRRCKYKEFLCSVHIHHIDKDRDNNKRENLIPLCANCHHGLHENLWDLSELCR